MTQGLKHRLPLQPQVAMLNYLKEGKVGDLHHRGGGSHGVRPPPLFVSGKGDSPGGTSQGGCKPVRDGLSPRKSTKHGLPAGARAESRQRCGRTPATCS